MDGMTIRISPSHTGIVVGSDINISECVVPDFVTEIGESAFAFRQRLRKVVLSNSVKCIRDRAFEGSRNLKEVKLSNSLSYIGSRAFCFCISLESLVLPESLETIGDYAFEDSALSTISIPKCVTSIGKGAFECRDLYCIEVDKENKSFISEDGVLFDKDMTTFVRYPRSRNGLKYDVPEGVINIEKRSFS